MREIICAALLVTGGLFMLLAAVGVVRMPDLFTRMQASTKAATLGASCTLLAAAVYFGELGITTRALATIMFFLITTPIAAHMIGRAAYFIGVPLWEGTIIDQLSGRYNPYTHLLEGPPNNNIKNIPEAENSDRNSKDE
jgi:multicomponent Na+:H+ antiporter subunit G